MNQSEIHTNLQAIALLKELQSTHQRPTPEQKSILSQFNGWGALWPLFKAAHPTP